MLSESDIRHKIRTGSQLHRATATEPLSGELVERDQCHLYACGESDKYRSHFDQYNWARARSILAYLGALMRIIQHEPAPDICIAADPPRPKMPPGEEITCMRKILWLLGLICCLTHKASAAEPALTIYNQNFAVVRDTVPLELKAGTNEVRFSNATAALEPDSVVLRDPAGKHSLQILEQNCRNDPVSQQLLLSLFEGKTIEFENISTKDNHTVRERIAGKIVRSSSGSGYYDAYGQYYGGEHLYRWSNWEIRAPSVPWRKTDAQTIEFRVTVRPEEEKAFTYTVHYSW